MIERFIEEVKNIKRYKKIHLFFKILPENLNFISMSPYVLTSSSFWCMFMCVCLCVYMYVYVCLFCSLWADSDPIVPHLHPHKRETSQTTVHTTHRPAPQGGAPAQGLHISGVFRKN